MGHLAPLYFFKFNTIDYKMTFGNELLFLLLFFSKIEISLPAQQ